MSTPCSRPSCRSGWFLPPALVLLTLVSCASRRIETYVNTLADPQTNALRRDLRSGFPYLADSAQPYFGSNTGQAMRIVAPIKQGQ